MIASKLTSALKLASYGFKVFPLAPNSKVPMKGFTDFAGKATTDKEQINEWWDNDRNLNIGISTDNLLVVDVDTKDSKKDGIETLAKLNREGRVLPPTAQQLTTTNGLHLIYKTPYPIRNSASKLGPGLDVRGRGGYIVGAGSTIGSKEYTIDFRPIPVAPDWLLDSCAEANVGKPRAHVKIEGVDPEKAKTRGLKYLNGIETVLGGSRNAEAFKVAAKLKDLGLEREDTFLMMMDEWKCEPSLELAELKAVVTSAYKYGKEAQGSAAPEAMFAPPVEENLGKHPFEIVNEEYAFVTMGSGHRILREHINHGGSFSVDYLHEETFHRKLASRKFQTADGQVKPLTKAWMASDVRRTYDSIVFSPGENVDQRYYNLWRGFSVEPLAENEKPTEIMIEAVRKFEEHLFVNICDSNTEYYDWVYGWFAHIIQKPWEKPGVALVMKGRKGVGKNVLLDCVGTLFRPNYMVTAQKRHMTGNFNSHMENLLLLVLDEAFWSGSKEDAGILKALITAPDLEIERKGVDSYTVKSRLRTAIIGNEDWIVPASEDERRYAVFNVGESRMQDTIFFTALNEGMNAGGNRYLLTKLMQFDLSKMDIRNAPQTEGLAEQKENSLSPVEKWWFDSISQGYFDGLSFNEGEWVTRIDWKHFVDGILHHLKSRRHTIWFGGDKELLRDLKKLMPVIDVSKNPGELLHIDLPSLEECRAAWEKRMRVTIPWRKI